MAFANAECAETLQARVEPCLRQILADHPGQQVAIACHGGVIRMLLGILLHWPLSRMAAFEIEYASLTQVLVRPQQSGVAVAQLHALARNHRVSMPLHSHSQTRRPAGPRSTMKRTPLWKISVTTTPEAEDAVAELLGAPSASRFPPTRMLNRQTAGFGLCSDNGQTGLGPGRRNWRRV